MGYLVSGGKERLDGDLRGEERKTRKWTLFHPRRTLYAPDTQVEKHRGVCIMFCVPSNSQFSSFTIGIHFSCGSHFPTIPSNITGDISIMEPISSQKP
jgi:hypothetical protein